MPRIVVYLALAIAVVCWGSSPVAIRYLISELNPLQIIIVRLIIGSLLFLPILLWSGIRKWSRRDLVVAVIWGILGVDGYYLPVTYGAQWLPSGTTGLISATCPIWIVIVSAIALRERLHRWLLLGLASSITGICILLGPSALSNVNSKLFLLGAGLTLLSSLMWSLYSVAVKPLSQKYGAIACTSLTTLGAATLPIAIWDQELYTSLSTLSPLAWGILIALALGSTVIAALAWNFGVVQIGASQAGLFLYLVPLLSVVGGHLFLNEPLTSNVILSSVLILAGVAIAQFGTAQPVPQPVTPVKE